MFFVTLSFAQSDSTKKSHNYFQIKINYGVPVFNKLSLYLDQDYGNYFTTNSKLKSCYNIEFTRVQNHFNFILGLTYLQSEFKGKDFEFWYGEIPYNGTRPPYTYTMYQRVKYNVLYANIGIGYNFKVNLKNKIEVNLLMSIPALYDFTIDNMYSNTSQVSDTTLFVTTKNGKNTDTNYGYLPRLNANISYTHFFTKKIGLNFNLSFIYAYTHNVKRLDDYGYRSVFNGSNNYSYLAYNVNKQYVLTPSIGFTFKIK
jgi:hypothetical protein